MVCLLRITAVTMFAAVLFSVMPLSAQGEQLPQSWGDNAKITTSARSAVLIEGESGRILYEKNAFEMLPMASTTKIMTALLTLRQRNLDEYFTVDPMAIRVEGTSMGLVEGDQVSLRGLACGMLLLSGNDAANAAAVRIAGSIPAFAEQMNEMAKAIGMNFTSFANPSGLTAEGHYSTAYDMALLGQEALTDPTFAAICSSKSLSVEYGNPPYLRRISGHNRLLREYEGCIGIKTGYTKAAGRCLVSAAVREGVQLIAVTLNAPNDWEDHTKMLDYGFSILTAQNVTEGLQTTVPVANGQKEQCVVLPAEKGIAALMEGERETLACTLCLQPMVYAPIRKGDVVGEAIYSLEGMPILTVPLVAGETVEMLTPERIEEDSGNFFFWIWEKIKGLFGR